MLILVKSFMVNSPYLVARCDTIPILVNLFQLFKVHLYGEKSSWVEGSATFSYVPLTLETLRVISVEYLLVISMLSKTEWSGELRT